MGILYYSRFRPDLTKGGGCRRVAQMLEVLESLDIRLKTTLPVEPSQDTPFPPTPSRVFSLPQRGWFRRFSAWSNRYAGYVNRLRAFAAGWAREMDWEEGEVPELALMDDPIYFLPLVHALRKRGVPIIACCHNLESLCPPQVNRSHQRSLLQSEVEALSACDLVVTISREEAVLLENLGVRVLFLPYYPPRAIEARLASIRENRLRSERLKGVLFLGNMGNLATRDSAVDFLTRSECSRAVEDLMFIVGGFGTEQLRNEPVSGKVDIEGTLTDARLDAILSEVRASVIYQKFGSGALTKVVEMLFAGVPVLGNSHALRTHYNLEGVVEYRSLAHLRQILHGGEFPARVDDIPLPRRPDSSELVEQIQGFL